MDKEQQIVQCRVCGKEVSKTAKSCPHCGQKRPYKAPTQWGWILATSLIVIMAFSVAGSFAPTEAPTQDNQVLSARHICKEGIKDKAINPSTVRMRAIDASAGYATDGAIIVTQPFTAKNAYGLEISFNAYCEIKTNGEFIFDVKEKR